MRFRHVSLISLTAAVLALSVVTPRAFAEPAVIDNFDDDSISDSWNETNTGTGASLSETNQRLEFHFEADSREGPAPPGAPFGDVSAGVNHECKLVGDFDVRVDFDVSGWPEENGVRLALVVRGASAQRTWDAIFKNKYHGGAGSGSGAVAKTDTTGKLRLSREDSTVTSSYMGAGGWQEIASGSVDEDPMSLQLRAWTHDHLLDARPEESQDDDITVTLDNLRLETGSLTCNEVKAVEFTQAIQELQTVDELMDDLEDDGKPPVPMIAGKPAAMRVYFDEVDQQTIRAVAVTGEITDAKPVTLVPGCDAEKRRKQEGSCESVDFYFTPPDGDWSITLNVYDSDGLREHYDFDLTSVEARGLTLKSVSVCDALSGGTIPIWQCEDPGKLVGVASQLRKVAPTDDVSVWMSGESVRYLPGDFSTPKDWWYRVVEDIDALYGYSDAITELALSDEIYYYGMARPTVPGTFNGIANALPSTGAFSRSIAMSGTYTVTPATVAHEVAHMLGISHTNVAAPGGTPGCWQSTASNPSWPYADNMLRSGAAPGDVEVGFDVAEKKALPGDKNFELMGYCHVRWISQDTTLKMLGPTGPLGGPGSGDESEEGTFWLVSGAIVHGSVQFVPLFAVETEESVSGGSGSHKIIVEDGGGTPLFTRLFDAVEPGPDIPPEGDDEHGPPSFSEVIPVEEDAARIVVLDGTETEIGSIDLVGAPPTVTISPVGGAGSAEEIVAVGWSVDDPDSAEHTYWVDYSPDGGETWVNQGMGLTDTALGLDPAMLAGSGTAVVRVIASDGVNSGMAVSAPFSVAKKLPQGEIIGPTLNVFRIGDLVWLEAAAWDADDGTLDDAAVNWNSSIDGALGNGASLPVYDLSEGTHTITMTAEDSDGNEVSDSVVVTVFDAPLSEVETGIKGDLDCDGDVDSVDALKGLQHNAGLPVVQEPDCTAIGSGEAGTVFGDVDCDDDVDSVDALQVLRTVAGLAANLPPGCKPIGV